MGLIRDHIVDKMLISNKNRYDIILYYLMWFSSNNHINQGTTCGRYNSGLVIKLN